MKPIESAERFIRSIAHEARVVDPFGYDQHVRTVIAMVEARDNAVRLELLDELIALDDGMALTLTVYQAVREMRAKYGDKP